MHLGVGDGTVFPDEPLCFLDCFFHGGEGLKTEQSRYLEVRGPGEKDLAEVPETIGSLSPQNKGMDTVEAESIPVFMDELRSMGVLFRVEIPQFEGVLGVRNELLEHLHVRRVFHGIELLIAGVNEDDNPSFFYQRNILKQAEAIGHTQVPHQDWIDKGHLAVGIPVVAHPVYHHIGLSFHLNDVLALEYIQGLLMSLRWMPSHYLHHLLGVCVVHGSLDNEKSAPPFCQFLLDDLPHLVEQLREGGTLCVHGGFSRGLGKGTVVMADAPEASQPNHSRLPAAVKRGPWIAHVDDLVRVDESTVHLHLLTAIGLPEKDQVFPILGIVVAKPTRP